MIKQYSQPFVINHTGQTYIETSSSNNCKVKTIKLTIIPNTFYFQKKIKPRIISIFLKMVKVLLKAVVLIVILLNYFLEI